MKATSTKMGSRGSRKAAERQRKYLLGQIKMPQKGVSVEQFVHRVLQMNTYLAYLPTTKDTEDCPAEVPRGDKVFSQLELCDLILNCIPYSLAIAYYAKKKPNYFVLSVKELMEELMLLEPQFERNQKLLEQVRLQNGKFSGGEP